jgi:hypothetical protein
MLISKWRLETLEFWFWTIMLQCESSKTMWINEATLYICLSVRRQLSPYQVLYTLPSGAEFIDLGSYIVWPPAETVFIVPSATCHGKLLQKKEQSKVMHWAIANFCTTNSPPFFFPSSQQQKWIVELHMALDRWISSRLWEVSKMLGPATSTLPVVTLNALLYQQKSKYAFELSRSNKRAQSIVWYSVCWVICTLVKLRNFEFRTLAGFWERRFGIPP